MANCNTITGIFGGCDTSSGGIYEAYFIDSDSVSATSVNTSAHTITAMTLDVGESFETFQFKRNVGNAVGTPTIDLNNGSTYYSYTISLMFHLREGIKSRAIQVLAEGQRYLDVIIKDANGKYWYYDHAQLNGGSDDTGTAKADGSKYTVTFLADMNNMAYEVSPSIIAALIA